MKPRALIAWSSGKDSAWALHRVRLAGEMEVVGALTTITENSGRVSMHACGKRFSKLNVLPRTFRCIR